MGPGEWELCKRSVVETDISPVHCGVADRAIAGESGLGVIGIRRRVQILEVAGHATGGDGLEDSAYVACCAIKGGVSPGERETGELQVIERGAKPVIHGVAGLAVGGQVQRPVIEHRSLEILGVARNARRGQTLELPAGRALVAGVALQHGVRAYQRKPIVVIADGLDVDLPSLHRVALLAVGSELAAVDVGVAICAMCTHIAEYQAGMALGAPDALVHTAQRVARLVVIELGEAAYRLPTGEGVAILAGTIKRAVRALHIGPGTGSRRRRPRIFLMRRPRILVRRYGRRQDG